ncbi:MAG TPA: hypothetical protein VGF94_17590 [Kofleriaceae bacterium]
MELVVDLLEPLDISTYELAVWCKLLRDRGWTGGRIAGGLCRSEGYVNNLIRIVDRASLAVLARWRREQQSAGTLRHACTTDWLAQVCLLPHAEQDAALAARIDRLARTAG